MIVFGRNLDKEPSAIIELKLDARRGNLSKITNDITRTSGLLSVSKPDVHGYQLICVVTE
jgi:hypothetical protein